MALMNVEKWKDLIELVALIAVVGSLIAVAVELRQTQTALQAGAYQARAFDGIAWNFEIAKDERIRKIQMLLESGEFDASELTADDLHIAEKLITITRIDLDNEHYQYQSGLLDPGFYFGETALRIKLSAPIWRELGGSEPRPKFREEVDRILSEGER
jgi:hypothetical protein